MKTTDVGPADPRLPALFPVLRQLRPHLTPELFRSVYEEGHAQGLRFTGVFDDGTDDDATGGGTGAACLGVAGWRLLVNTNMLRTLHVEDLVTTSAARSRGVGRALLGHLEQRARDLDCRALTLDSGTQRTGAHRFYHREQMGIAAFHFVKRLDGPE
ncbi:GNAT family N-acetyltransferase [Streptomyces cacaoi]|uniref:GNAT family N-acetyltransferase n=1 Tax=Streptomyces cacaoi TaxID=1898 RepID=UPI002628A0F2|nr:GNAT family N-acetyltransferase [Streptomyces cacaoi]